MIFNFYFLYLKIKMVFIVDLINDSVVLRNIEDFKELTPEEYYDEDGTGFLRLRSIIGEFVTDYSKLEMMYEGNYDFTDDELLILINQLNYIDNKYLIDVIIFAKYRESELIEISLNEDLSKIYNEYMIGGEIFTEFIGRKNIGILKWIYKENTIDEKILEFCSK